MRNQARQPITAIHPHIGCRISQRTNTKDKFMSDILTKAIVLVLNRNWQAINVRTPQEAFCMMATNVATGLEIEGEDHIRPVTWEEWIRLPIREQDEAVRTVRGPRMTAEDVLTSGGSGSCLALSQPYRTIEIVRRGISFFIGLSHEFANYYDHREDKRPKNHAASKPVPQLRGFALTALPRIATLGHGENHQAETSEHRDSKSEPPHGPRQRKL